jgi:glycopeptide antibiotics resistance protein
VAASVYAAALVVLLVAPLNIVHYHSRFWELMWRCGIRWTALREKALDEILNAALFVPLAALFHGLCRGGKPFSRRTICETLSVATILAIGIETIQIFLPSRHASIADVMAYVIGAAIGVGLDATSKGRK